MTIDRQAGTPAAITRRLAADEQLVWWDRPEPSLFARRELNFGVLFGAFFLLFALFWMSMAWQAPGVFFVFGVPFVLFGLWMASTPLRAYWDASAMLFALTDKRALILTGSKAAARPLEHVEYVETESFADGSGHVLFINEAASFSPWTWNMQPMMRKSGFIAVADAERVGSEMLKLMANRRTADQRGEIPE
jgi:hypothetical protein